MMTDKATYEQLEKALEEVYDYADNSKRNQQVKRAFRRGKEKVIRRVNTPKHKYTALYYYYKDGKEINHSFHLVLKGVEGDSFATLAIYNDVEYDIIVLHSHAINRYIQRANVKESLEEAQILLTTTVPMFKAVHDSDTYYSTYFEGVFLGNVVDRVLHLRTFINTDQCHQNQKLWRIKSANSLSDLAKQMKEMTKQLENA